MWNEIKKEDSNTEDTLEEYMGSGFSSQEMEEQWGRGTYVRLSMIGHYMDTIS